MSPSKGLTANSPEPPDQDSRRLRRNGMVVMAAALVAMGGLDQTFRDEPDVWASFVRNFRENAAIPIALALGFELFVALWLFGFFVVLAGLKEQPLRTSKRARAGIRTKLLGANLILATAFLLSALQSSPSIDSWVAYGAVPIAAWFGVNLLRVGFRHDVAAAEDLLSRDHRAPVVYIRSFQEDDDLLIPWYSRVLGGFAVGVTFEQILAATFNQVGPFVAIGRPAEALPELGAARVYYKDTEWRAKIVELMGSARLVVIRAGGTENLWWEIEHARRTVDPRRVIVAVVERGKTASDWLSRLGDVIGRPIHQPADRIAEWARPMWNALFGGNLRPLFVTFNSSWEPRLERCRYRLSASGLKNPAWPSIEYALQRALAELGIEVRGRKSRVTACVLGLLLGWSGAHYFYTGQRRRGWVCLLLWWTVVPAGLGIRDAVRMTLASREEFEARYPGFALYPEASYCGT
jgi:TM2 domain-containing membrane protein YozV